MLLKYTLITFIALIFLANPSSEWLKLVLKDWIIWLRTYTLCIVLLVGCALSYVKIYRTNTETLLICDRRILVFPVLFLDNYLLNCVINYFTVSQKTIYRATDDNITYALNLSIKNVYLSANKIGCLVNEKRTDKIYTRKNNDNFTMTFQLEQKNHLGYFFPIHVRRIFIFKNGPLYFSK